MHKATPRVPPGELGMLPCGLCSTMIALETQGWVFSWHSLSCSLQLKGCSWCGAEVLRWAPKAQAVVSSESDHDLVRTLAPLMPSQIPFPSSFPFQNACFSEMFTCWRQAVTLSQFFLILEPVRPPAGTVPAADDQALPPCKEVWNL